MHDHCLKHVYIYKINHPVQFHAILMLFPRDNRHFTAQKFLCTEYASRTASLFNMQRILTLIFVLATFLNFVLYHVLLYLDADHYFPVVLPQCGQ